MNAIHCMDQDHLDAMGKDFRIWCNTIDAPETLPAGSMYQGLVRRNHWGELIDVIPYRSTLDRQQ